MSEKWVSAKEAELIARRYNLELPIHRLNKLIDQDPPPFRSRKPSRQRLEVAFADLHVYLEEQERSQGRTPGSGQTEPEQPNELERYEQLLKAEKQERHDRAAKQKEAQEERDRARQERNRR